MTRPLSVCRHEAAHAVVASHLGVKVDKVLIGEEGAFSDPEHGMILGYTVFRPERKTALAYAIALAAGTAADRLFGAGDYSQVDKQGTIDAGFSARDWPHLVALAKNLLRGPLAKAFTAVTAALEHTDLTGAQVRRIVRRYRA